MRICIFIFLFYSSLPLLAQRAILTGVVTSRDNVPIEGVNIRINENVGTGTDQKGWFRLGINNEHIQIEFLHINYKPKTLSLALAEGETRHINVVLEEKIETLKHVEILGESDIREMSQPSFIRVSPKAVQSLPTPFGEFNKILSTMPGVIAHNEFSSSYMVRGGNYDENLVYVNDMPIYRPFLVRSGQQEGLSFINPDLVDNIEFSSGGWQPRYGDKLSSSLHIGYKKPSAFKASLSAGLLGGTAHLEGTTNDSRLRYLFGMRHKQWKYLLNTLETEGEYQPNFTDIQAFISIDLDGQAGIQRKSSSELDLLLSYARNRYNVIPESRQAFIGNILTDVIRLNMEFEGMEALEYDTYQAGARLSRRFNNRIRNVVIFSGFATREREYFDVEGIYRLCDIDRRPGSPTFDRCLSIRGLGSNYNYGRNRMEAGLINVEDQLSVLVGGATNLEAGIGYNRAIIDDWLREYSLIDSVGYATIDNSISSMNDISYGQVSGYLQATQNFSGIHMTTYGVRFHYHEMNGQLLASPRIQYAFKPTWNSDWTFKLSTGIYRQPPFYREFRDIHGNLNRKIKAQSSLHLIAGIDHKLRIWERDFRLISEAYWKRLYNVVPYDIDNVRIRYMADNLADAYAMGVDVRLSGEFVPGTESWLSLGILETRENLKNDQRGYIRRPTDQRVTLSMFFEDHFANDPTMRMNLNLQFGTGLPYGPPNNTAMRNVFRGNYYNRVDLGLSKMITGRMGNEKAILNSVWVGAEILNLLANENTVSYTWIKDFNNTQYAIPNVLSSRFFNVKVYVR